MKSPEVEYYLKMAEESHQAAQVLIDGGIIGFSAAQSYYTMFYLAQAFLLSKDMTFSSHSAVISFFGKEFAKTGLVDPKFHRYLINAQERREIGHYGTTQKVSSEQAIESYQWAEEFLKITYEYFSD